MKYTIIQFYRDVAGEFRWRMRSANGRILCDSAEGYKTKRGCKNGYEGVLKNFQGVVEEVFQDSWAA